MYLTPGDDQLLGHPTGQGIEGHRPAQCLLQTRVFGEGPDQPPQFHRVNHLIDHQHFDQAGTGQRTATRFIRIAIKDRLQVNALQSREQQRDDGDRLDHAKPLSGVIPHLSLPDREKVRITASPIDSRVTWARSFSSNKAASNRSPRRTARQETSIPAENKTTVVLSTRRKSVCWVLRDISPNRWENFLPTGNNILLIRCISSTHRWISPGSAVSEVI